MLDSWQPSPLVSQRCSSKKLVEAERIELSSKTADPQSPRASPQYFSRRGPLPRSAGFPPSSIGLDGQATNRSPNRRSEFDYTGY